MNMKGFLAATVVVSFGALNAFAAPAPAVSLTEAMKILEVKTPITDGLNSAQLAEIARAASTNGVTRSALTEIIAAAGKLKGNAYTDDEKSAEVVKGIMEPVGAGAIAYTPNLEGALEVRNNPGALSNLRGIWKCSADLARKGHASTALSACTMQFAEKRLKQETGKEATVAAVKEAAKSMYRCVGAPVANN